MTVSQQDFRAAVLDPQVPVPSGLRNPKGGPAGARFSVYRNNVVVSLCDALDTAFPLVRKLIGAEAFARLARVFVRQHPPSSPLMMFYGEELPVFLNQFQSLAHLSYLPDCARLDLGLRESYHEADAAPFDASVLQQDPTAAMQLSIALAPSTRIIRSDWPVFDIWRYNFETDAPKPSAGAQDVLIARPGFDPVPHLLPTGAADWLQKLDAGMTFGQATELVMAQTPSFNLTDALALALRSSALMDRTTKEN